MQFPIHIRLTNKHCSDVSETSFVVFGKCHCSGKTDILHPEKLFTYSERGYV